MLHKIKNSRTVCPFAKKRQAKRAGKMKCRRFVTKLAGDKFLTTDERDKHR
jgi:hypothetical protein